MKTAFQLIEEHGLTLHGDIERFAELVRADEREACAKVCETEWSTLGQMEASSVFAATIRARSNT